MFNEMHYFYQGDHVNDQCALTDAKRAEQTNVSKGKSRKQSSYVYVDGRNGVSQNWALAEMNEIEMTTQENSDRTENYNQTLSNTRVQAEKKTNEWKSAHYQGN